MDISKLRSPRKVTKQVNEKKELLAVRFGKPSKNRWFRVHPDHYVEDVATIDYREEMATYVLQENVTPYVSDAQIKWVTLHLCVTEKKDLFVWPVSQKDSTNAWYTSARDAVKLAVDKWVRIEPNLETGCYDAYLPDLDAAVGGIEPFWGEMSFEDVLDLALKDVMITTPEHAVIRQLAGDVIA